MNTLWTYFWPPLVAGLLAGAIFGLMAFYRPRRRKALLAAGAAVALALTGLWHGPLGAANRFSGQVERNAHQALVYYEMTQVQARLARRPMTRQLLLSGRADDFQQSELVRVMSELPGVRQATWSKEGSGLPLIAEGAIAALVGYLVGLALAYLVGLRRRYNEQWNW